MITVIATSRGEIAEKIMSAMLPTESVILTASRRYAFYDIGGDAGQFEFLDVDGEVLTEYHSFATLEAAQAWVTADAREHGGGR